MAFYELSKEERVKLVGKINKDILDDTRKKIFSAHAGRSEGIYRGKFLKAFPCRKEITSEKDRPVMYWYFLSSLPPSFFASAC